jgi:hypothetical protein
MQKEKEEGKDRPTILTIHYSSSVRRGKYKQVGKI